MATIVIADRTVDAKTTRNRINGVDLKETVNTFKLRVSSSIMKNDSDFDLVYCGQCLAPTSSLESYGINTGATLHALKKICYPESEPEATGGTTSAEIKQIQQLLQTAIKNPAYKSTVDNIVNNAETLHDFVNAVPGLSQYPSTLVLFIDQELLSVLAHPGNIRRMIEAHPCFVPVARMISAAVNEAETKGEYVRSSTGAYSLDQMSDEDEPSQPSGQPITANQLAAALAAATGMPAQTQAQQSPGSSNSNPAISTDFFQQAILQAQNVAIMGQIDQMREMGITDENVARQALQATNGDLQAALDLIFGGGFS